MPGEDPERQGSAEPAVIAPGNHDGVHLGHRALLTRARQVADQQGLAVRALTFDPHPTAVLAPERAPALLTTMERRRQLLLTAGADDVWVQPFSRQYAALSPAQFFETLVRHGAHALVVGPDFHFGKNRAGNVESLRELGTAAGVQVHLEAPVALEGLRVSSTAVRKALAAGQVEQASAMLSRVHEIEGEVIHGEGRGRSLGFPTANLTPGEVLVPADGVYAVVARVLGHAGGLLQGVANVGQRPTFQTGHSIEAHLFDYAGDLYGKSLRVGFVARIRDERRFSGVEALRAQIDKDCAEARARLAEQDGERTQWI